MNDPPRRPVTYSPGVNGAVAAIRVLVLDDEPSIRLLCRVNLELDGCEVVEAASIGEARRLIDEEPVDVVVVDLHVHGERSSDLIAECRAREPRLPVVLVTGSVETSELGAAGAGADSVLGKPFEMERLVELVHRLAGR